MIACDYPIWIQITINGIVIVALLIGLVLGTQIGKYK